MNQQHAFHLRATDTIETRTEILSTGDSPVLNINVRTQDGDEIVLVLFFESGPAALNQLERIQTGIEDLRERVHEALEVAVPRPFGYSRPRLVATEGSTTV